MVEQPMRAVQVYEYGGPEVLQMTQMPRPQAQAGEVLVRVQAAGVLPADWKARQGMFKAYAPRQFPYIPGSAIAGVVEGVGPQVSQFQQGQAVFGRTTHGAYAEYTVAAVETLAIKPDALSFAEAATISAGATTAWNALFENGDLQAGQRVLIHGAAGGVGLFAVQLARWKGAHVIGTASAANVDFVRSLGAETVIDYGETRFEDALDEVDLVLGTIGGEVLERSMMVVKRGGVLISLLEPPSQAIAEERGIRAMTHSVTQPFPATQLLETIAALMTAGEIRTVVQRTFSLAAVQDAHRLSETGHGRGRIVLVMG